MVYKIVHSKVVSPAFGGRVWGELITKYRRAHHARVRFWTYLARGLSQMLHEAG